MNSQRTSSNPDRRAAGHGRSWLAHHRMLGLVLLFGPAVWWSPGVEQIIPYTQPGSMLSKQGEVKYQAPAHPESPAKVPQGLGFGDSLRTLIYSRAVVEFRDTTMLSMQMLTQLVITNEPGTGAPVMKSSQGQIYVVHHGGGLVLSFEAPHGVKAVPKGTEFLFRVDPIADQTEVTTFDGEVELTNDTETRRVPTGFQGIAAPGQKIRLRPILEATNIVQWWIYYPAVLDTRDLALSETEQKALAASLEAYQAGDLRQALERLPGYPQALGPASEPQRVYFAALMLGVGAVADAKRFLEHAGDTPSARALRWMIDAVAPPLGASDPRASVSIHSPSPTRHLDLTSSASFTASEWLAMSYALQAQHDLTGALNAARASVKLSPQFGFGWARVAELEFGFGRTRAAREAIERAIAHSPRNAQSQAVRGFLLAAENRTAEALRAFEAAITLDPGLANSTLGRGLVKIRRGHFREGLLDLETASILEPRRSLLRSYLGKGYADAGKGRLAGEEFRYARQLDPNDPTPWLYSALLDWEEYRLHEAISDLEQSIALNDNRALFRSRMLLDQDQAVRSASLASIYADAGMLDVSLREAARAVDADYANYSAHLFLANSYDGLRDPTRFNLRYETPWFNELLLANLLAPPGVPTLSANISQQEYSRLFERDRLGLTTTTEVRSDGQYRELASQFGARGPFSYSLDLDWQHNNGVRPNNELDRTEWYSQLKYQLTPQDSVLGLIKYQDYDAGDNFQYYDASSARPAFHFSEVQTPLLLAGWHREWSPGVHTLFLGGRLVNDQRLGDTNAAQTIAVVNPAGVLDPRVVPFDVSYRSRFEIYSAELNQVFQREKHTDIFGARFQDGTFRADNTFLNPPPALAPLFALPSVSAADNDFLRVSLYAYHHWQIVDRLMLIGGLAYDDVRFPANFRRPPLNSDESHRSQVSPKAALLWDITPRLRARAVYAQALGGVSYDESVRLEPTQLAGFSQSFRSLISESLVGSVEAPRYEIAGGAFDIRPWRDAWLSLQGEVLRERVERELGVFNFDFGDSPPATPASASEQIGYREYNARLVFNQSLGREWFLETRYQYTRSELARSLPDIAATAAFARTTRTEADWHEFGLAATWQHPSGFFARGEFTELVQQLEGSIPQPPGDDLPLLDLYTGYRFPHRRGEIVIGVMNLGNADYHFSPLNYHPEFPHSRVVCARLTLNF